MERQNVLTNVSGYPAVPVRSLSGRTRTLANPGFQDNWFVVNQGWPVQRTLNSFPEPVGRRRQIIRPRADFHQQRFRVAAHRVFMTRPAAATRAKARSRSNK